MPIYLRKSLAGASSGYGVISTAATPVTTLTSATFDTQRRVTFLTTTAADFSGLTLTVTGTQDGGNTMVESIIGSTTSTLASSVTPWTTTQDFKTISSIVASSIPNQPVYMATSCFGGTPWQLVNTAATPTNIGFSVTYATTRTVAAAVLEYSLDNPPGQGLQNPNSSWAEPFPITSTSISTAANTNSVGVCQIPISCWRLTVVSTSTATTTPAIYLNAIQAGLGSIG